MCGPEICVYRYCLSDLYAEENNRRNNNGINEKEKKTAFVSFLHKSIHLFIKNHAIVHVASFMLDIDAGGK